MKIVIAIDSFKGSLSSKQAGEAAKEGILRVFPDAEILVKPLADGGEGTTSALVEGLGGDWIELTVQGPLGELTLAHYGIINKDTAIIEMAEASGITLVPPDQLDPYRTSTFGFGQMISDALDRGIRKFIIGIGGSATTEGGIGMLQALGAKFVDESGELLPPFFNSLGKVYSVDVTDLHPEISNSQFLIASDVTNPLTGSNGSVSVFGPQKGVKPEEIEIMDNQMKHYAELISKELGTDFKDAPGAGAAGGLGFAFLSFFPNCTLTPGIDLILEQLNFKEDLKDTDILITGEGRLDNQTAMGKVPVGVAKLAKQISGAKTIAFCGSAESGAEECNDNGIDAFFPILREVVSLEEAMDLKRAQKSMADTVEQVMRLLK